MQKDSFHHVPLNWAGLGIFILVTMKQDKFFQASMIFEIIQKFMKLDKIPQASLMFKRI